MSGSTNFSGGGEEFQERRTYDLRAEQVRVLVVKRRDIQENLVGCLNAIPEFVGNELFRFKILIGLYASKGGEAQGLRLY